MRTETLVKEIYSFEELTEAAKQKAIDDVRNSPHYLDHDWWEFTYENWKEKLLEHGFDATETKYRMSYKWDSENKKRVENGKKHFTETTINFSGFWSQGDGASFTAKSVDVCTWILKNEPVKYARLIKLCKSNALYLSGKVVRDRWCHYVHHNTISFYLNDEFQGDYKSNLNNIEQLLEELERNIQEHAMSLSKDIYEDLEEDYEYQMSNEAIQEHIEANEYEFEENGSRY